MLWRRPGGLTRNCVCLYDLRHNNILVCLSAGCLCVSLRKGAVIQRRSCWTHTRMWWLRMARGGRRLWVTHWARRVPLVGTVVSRIGTFYVTASDVTGREPGRVVGLRRIEVRLSGLCIARRRSVTRVTWVASQ